MKDDLGSDSLSLGKARVREPHTKARVLSSSQPEEHFLFFFFVHWAPGGTTLFGFECSG